LGTRRSRENLLTLVGRLYELGFEFWSGDEHFLLTEMEVAEPWSAIWSRDTSDVGVQILECTPDTPRVLPLSLRVWLSEVGGRVQFEGRHPVVCPYLGNPGPPLIYTDPFSIIPAFDPTAMPLVEFGTDTEDEPADILIMSWADQEKSMYWSKKFWAEKRRSEDLPQDYDITCPNGAIDAKIEGIWYETTFVGYIRKNFQWGGFPGWERYPNRPEKELQFLREGLLPI